MRLTGSAPRSPSGTWRGSQITGLVDVGVMSDHVAMDDFRWIGREGEKAFSLLCSTRRVTCNKAEEDDRGYDFIVHYPVPTMLHLPIDQRAGGVSALVQIKTTGVDAQRWSISLSNALSLARSPLPAFIVRVGRGVDGFTTYRAVHLWQGELARILKAARQAHVDGDEAVHKRYVPFALGPDTARADILEWMRSQVDAIGEAAYAAGKALLVDTLGFEDGHGVARLRLARSSARAMADLQLGLVGGVDLKRFSFTSRRFGIEGPVPDIEVSDCRLEMEVEGTRGALRLKSGDGLRETVDAEMFKATVPGRWFGRTRIRAGFLELLSSPDGRFTAQVRENRNARVTLEEVAALALVRQSSRASPLIVGLRSGGAFQDVGRINMRSEGGSGWRQLHSITRSLRDLVAFEGADPILVSIGDIDACFRQLSVLDALVAPARLRLDFTPIEERAGEVDAMLSYVVVRFGGVEVGAVASRRVAADVSSGGRRRIDFGPASILHASVNDGRGSSLEDLYRDELDLLSETAGVLAVGDLQRVVDASDGVLTMDEPRRIPRHADHG